MRTFPLLWGPVLPSWSTDKPLHTLVHGFMAIRVDYCNALLYGVADGVILHAAARLITGIRRSENITPTLFTGCRYHSASPSNCADDVRLYCGIWSRAGSKLFLAYLVFRFVQRNNQNGLPPGSVPDPTRADTPTRHSPEPPVGFEGWLHSKGKRKGRKHARYKFLAMALILDVASAQQQWLCSVANSHDQTGMHLAF